MSAAFKAAAYGQANPPPFHPLCLRVPVYVFCSPIKIKTETIQYPNSTKQCNATSSNKSFLKPSKAKRGMQLVLKQVTDLRSSFHGQFFSMSNCWSKKSSQQFQFLIFSCNSKWCNFNLKLSYSMFVTILSVTTISREMYESNTRVLFHPL